MPLIFMFDKWGDIPGGVRMKGNSGVIFICASGGIQVHAISQMFE